jgi:hypothetical protein
MSDDAVGLVMLGMAMFFTLVGSALAWKALDKLKGASEATREAAVTLARTSTADADTAQLNTVVGDAIGEARDALKTLTGPFAPARVLFALALLCLLAALGAFDIISLSVGNEAESAAE